MSPPCLVPFRSKFSIASRYKEPSYDRKLLLAACEPIIPMDRRPSWEKCRAAEVKAKMKADSASAHPYEEMLARELRHEMQSSKLIAFYHKNAVEQETFVRTRNALQNKNFWLRWFNRKVYDLAIHNTKFAAIRPMLCDLPNTLILIAKEDANLKTLLQMDKKMHGLLLMFAFLEDRFVRKDELLSYSQMGSLDEVRAQLSATLNHALASLPSHITHPATLLSLSLDQYVKQDQGNNKKD